MLGSSELDIDLILMSFGVSASVSETPVHSPEHRAHSSPDG
jgi:hypothetical protein